MDNDKYMELLVRIDERQKSMNDNLIKFESRIAVVEEEVVSLEKRAVLKESIRGLISIVGGVVGIFATLISGVYYLVTLVIK